MRFIKSSALVAALCVVGASGAYAGEKDTAAACQAAASQVNTTLASAQNDAARKERNLGAQACNSGFYQVGLLHYSKAMELMGSKLAAN